jgi:hypothetical protein
MESPTMVESTTVTVGLDAHAHSVRRLAAVSADELVEKRTLPLDEQQSVNQITKPLSFHSRYSCASAHGRSESHRV